MTKKCYKCRVQKPIHEFYKCRANKDGLASYCQTCDNKRQREWYKSDPKRRAQQSSLNRRRELELKQLAFKKYGGLVCACCGELEECFLTIDHIDGGGHRKFIGNGHFYRWLYQHDYPDGYQVLCMNCNFGRYMNGGICPHQENFIWHEK